MFGDEEQISGVGEQVVVAFHTFIWFKPILQPQRKIPEFLLRVHISVRAARIEDRAILDLKGRARRCAAAPFGRRLAIGPDDESPSGKVFAVEEPLETFIGASYFSFDSDRS